MRAADRIVREQFVREQLRCAQPVQRFHVEKSRVCGRNFFILCTFVPDKVRCRGFKWNQNMNLNFMKRSFKILLLAFGGAVFCCGGCSSGPEKGENRLPEWALGGFVRPAGANPVITPDPQIRFFCPMRRDSVGWMESDTFNPAATVRDGKICVLFRAEDNSATGIGKRTSRIGLAETGDGVTMQLRHDPVLFPAEDNQKENEWPGGCEDPRVAMTEDGTYVMLYTAWNRRIPRLCVATSPDLVNWTKHGFAFEKAYDGRFRDLKSKSASIVTRLDGDRLVVTRVNGKYLMYWGERMVNIATSDNLIDWTPELNEKGELKGVVYPREGYFDSDLTECGPPAVLTDKGILVLYNGRNRTDSRRDMRYPGGTYSAGQLLFDAAAPDKLIGRLDVPFFRPMDTFEKSGQYKDGTVFIEGLVYYKSKWYLYYGCADSQVGVAVYDPAAAAPGDSVPETPEA